MVYHPSLMSRAAAFVTVPRPSRFVARMMLSSGAADALPPLPPSMTSGVQLGVDFVDAIASETHRLGCSRPFIMSSNSMRGVVERLVGRLTADGCACETFAGVTMGGGEEGLLVACDTAKGTDADLVITVGGGAVQDLGKIVRLWLAAETTLEGEDTAGKASLDILLNRAAGASSDLVLKSVPQLAVPTGFAQVGPPFDASLAHS